MPGSGGTYVYLREAFQYRTGRLMPFLFIWTAMLFIPLIMSTGIHGMVQYLQYLWPSMTTGQGDILGIGLTALLVLMLWRKVENIGKLTVAHVGRDDRLRVRRDHRLLHALPPVAGLHLAARRDLADRTDRSGSASPPV